MPQRPETVRDCEDVHARVRDGTPRNRALRDVGISDSSYSTWCRNKGIGKAAKTRTADRESILAAAEGASSTFAEDQNPSNLAIAERIERQGNLYGCADFDDAVEAVRERNKKLIAESGMPIVEWTAPMCDPDAGTTYGVDKLIRAHSFAANHGTLPLLDSAEQEQYLDEILTNPEFRAAWPVAAECFDRHPPIITNEALQQDDDESLHNVGVVIGAYSVLDFEANGTDEPKFVLGFPTEISPNIFNHEVAHLIVGTETRAQNLEEDKDWTEHGAVFRGTLALLTDQTHGTEIGDLYRTLYVAGQESERYLASKLMREGASPDAVISLQRAFAEDAGMKRLKPVPYTNGLITRANDF